MSQPRRRRPQVPELFGTWEVSHELDIRPANIDKQVGLPEPVTRVKASRLWLADEIREFGREREERRARQKGNDTQG